jgi:hypothetical protein
MLLMSIIPTTTIIIAVALQDMEELRANSRFFFDVVYLHQQTTRTNNPQLVFDSLIANELPPPRSYTFEVSGNKHVCDGTTALDYIAWPRHQVLY